MTFRTPTPTHPFARLRLPAALLALMLGAGLLQACESYREIADAADPTEWFAEDEPPPEGAQREDKPVPGEDEDYPELSSVPEKPPEPEIKSRFEELRSGLISDRENARYSDEAIRRTPPPDRARADAAMQALNQQPSEPPTASVDENAFTAPPADGGAPTVQSTPQPSAPQPAAPQPSAPSGPESAATGADTGASTVAPEPAPAQTAAAAPADDSSGTASQSATSAPAPEPLGGNADGADQAARPAPPPDSAADMAREADAGTGERQDAPAADNERLIATIYFPGGGSALTDHDRDILRQVAQIFSEGGQQVRVIGHSAVRGQDGAQQAALVGYKASLDRASAVAGALVDHGIPRDALSVDARGANAPRYDESTDAGVAANRRAEVFISF